MVYRQARGLEGVEREHLGEPLGAVKRGAGGERLPRGRGDGLRVGSGVAGHVEAGRVMPEQHGDGTIIRELSISF